MIDNRSELDVGGRLDLPRAVVIGILFYTGILSLAVLVLFLVRHPSRWNGCVLLFFGGFYWTFIFVPFWTRRETKLALYLYCKLSNAEGSPKFERLKRWQRIREGKVSK